MPGNGERGLQWGRTGTWRDRNGSMEFVLDPPDAETAVVHHSCRKCQSSGDVPVVMRAAETLDDLATRHEADTKIACIDGCRYTVTRVDWSRV